MRDEMTLTLNSPITEEQLDAITDVDFEHTDRIWFNTKHGKTVEFIKKTSVPRWIPCSERCPEEEQRYLTSTIYGEVYSDYFDGERFCCTERVLAWMPLPEPYKEVEPLARKSTPIMK